MYSHIYQITGERRDRNAWVTSEYLSEHPDFLPVADAVNDVKSRDDAIQSFGSWLEQNKLGSMFDDSFVLAPEAAELYFEGRFTAFQQAVIALQKLNEDQFLHQHGLIQGLIDRLGEIFSDVRNPHVLLDGRVEAVPLDEFMRSARSGVPYYIGGVLDFHY